MRDRKLIMKKILKSAVKIIVVSYLGFVLILYFFQKNYIYYPNRQDFKTCPYFLDSEKISIDGTRAYYKNNNSQNLFIFYHGNAGSACDRFYMKKYLEKNDLDYLIVEYSGYSNDSRKPSKELILQDVKNINDFVNHKNYQQIIITGESLGASVAVYHSTLIDIDKLLLISPFYSLNNIAKRVYPIYPINLLSTQNFDSSLWMKSSQAKEIRIIHGSQDEIVPIEESKKLFNEIEKVNKEFVVVPHAYHNDIYDFTETDSSINEFIK